MNIVLFDEVDKWRNLLPLTFTRPISKLRIGILTIDEKWNYYFSDSQFSFLTQDHLKNKFPLNISESNYFINGSLIPNETLCKQISELKENEGLVFEQTLLAFKGSRSAYDSFQISTGKKLDQIPFIIKNVFDIFQRNGEALKIDFDLLTKNRKSKTLSSSVTVTGNKDLVFLEEGAVAEACILNTKYGPIYIGKDAEIMEGSIVRGPFSLGDHSTLKMGSKVYGPTTVGPQSKVGGEVNNSVIFGYSNKAHDGFLGNSVIGEWCNLGADTNNSNLKNNYGNVKLHNYLHKKMIDTGLQFCGLIMGDHSKCGINTMFNTGTVVGVGSNIFGGGFPQSHIPSFSWGGSEGFVTYKLEKFYETAEKVYERRGLKLDDTEKTILETIFKNTIGDR